MLRTPLFVALVLVPVGVAAACSNASVEPGADAAVTDGDASTISDSARADAADAKPTSLACYQDDAALVVEGIAPKSRAGVCSAPQIDDAYAKCIAATDDCDAWIAANRACARCMFGVLDDDDPKTTPIGAAIPISESALGANEGSCAALVLNRPACAVPLARQATCTRTVCATCTQSDARTCTDAASIGVCAFTVDTACTQAIAAGENQWIPTCRGASPQEAIRKVATYLCGP